MSNSVLHKKQKLLFAPQATIGTGATPTSSTYVLPCEEIEFSLDRGSLNIDRSGLHYGFPGSVIHGRGSAGWSLSFTAEIHDSTDQINPSLEPLVICGMKAEDDGGSTVYTISRDCLLSGLTGSLPEGPGVGTFWLVEDCGVTKKAQDVTGTATFNLEAGERALISYELVGRAQGATIEDTVIETTGTELALGTAEDWGLPYVCTAMQIKVDDEDPVNLQSVEIALNMEVSDVGDPLALSGLGIVKPELADYINVSFNVAQDANNRVSFWQKFFNGGKITLSIEMDGPDGGSLEIVMNNLRHDAPTTEDVNGRRHYGMQLFGFIEADELNDPATAFENLLKIVYTPATSS